jgi:hypothetical protein
MIGDRDAWRLKERMIRNPLEKHKKGVRSAPSNFSCIVRGSRRILKLVIVAYKVEAYTFSINPR